MRTIPLTAIPGQQFTVTLDDVRFALTIKEARGVMVCDLSANSEVVLSGTRVLAGEMIIPYRYLEDAGNFILMTINDELPDWRQFGVSQFLYYLTTAEMEAMRG